MNGFDFSIIIPVYNTEKYIADTIHSIEMQSGVTFELILVDDGSKDHSLNICNDMKLKYDNIVCIHQENQGAPAARNKGFKACRGKYVIFFDSDDLMVEGYLKKVKNMIDMDSPDLIISNYSTITEQGDLIKRDVIKKLSHHVDFDLYMGAPYPCCKVYKSKIIMDNDLVFDNVKIGQDLNFYLKYISKVKNIAVLDETSTLYRILNNSISSMKDERILDIIQSINKVLRYYEETNVDFTLRNNVYIVGLSNVVYQYSKLENLPYTEVVGKIELRFKEAFTLVTHQIKIKSLKQLLTYVKINIKYFKIKCNIKLNK